MSNSYRPRRTGSRVGQVRDAAKEKSPRKWWYVREGNRVSSSESSATDAKKHAAWLVACCGGKRSLSAPGAWWGNVVTITGPGGEGVSFDDYEFRDGEPRRIKV